MAWQSFYGGPVAPGFFGAAGLFLVDEIIVVDDESTDKTIEIVKRYTDKIFHRKMDNEGKHRNWAYSLARNSWVLSLDADERVTPELKDELIRLLSNASEFKAFSIPRRNYIGDYWIKYGGLYG